MAAAMRMAAFSIAALLSQEASQVCCISNFRGSAGKNMDVETDSNPDSDEGSFAQTEKYISRSGTHSTDEGVKVAQEHVLPLNDVMEGGFGVENSDKEDTGFMKAAKDMTMASARQLDDLYMRLNARVDGALVRELDITTPEIIRALRRSKSPMRYPHMHVVNHKIVDKSTKNDGDSMNDSTSLALDDDRAILGLTCFALLALSVFFQSKSGDDGSGKSHNSHDCHHVGDSSDKKLSVWDGTVTTLTSIMSMGFLSLPYAMSLAGWIAAPLMVFFTACAGYTAHLLTWSLSDAVEKARARGLTVPAMPGWGFLLGTAFGPKAERAVNVFLVVELWGYSLSGIVATALNLNTLLDDIGPSSAIGLTVLVQYILTTVPMKTLTKVNVISNVVFIFCCFMFILTGLCLPTKAPASDLKWVKADGLLAACGIIVFSPCAHSLFPAMMQRMEKPKEYPLCIRRAYVLAIVAYVALAVPGYYYFGNSAQPSAVMNIGVDRNLVPLPNLGWMNTVAAVCMVMKMSGLQPLVLTPLHATLEYMMQDWAPQRVLATFIPPVVLTVSAVVAMQFAHQMAALLDIVGSVFCMSIAFVLPVVCYWKLSQSNFGALQKAIFASLIGMGGTFAILGLIAAVGA